MQDVDDAVTYMKGIFWTYANNQRYNYSREQYQSAVIYLLSCLDCRTGLKWDKPLLITIFIEI